MNDAPPPRPARGRRLALYALTGAAAVGAGVLWRERQLAPGPATADAALFWNRSLPTPDGAPLDGASLRGAPLLVNFWATWCPPCVKELPEIDRFHATVRAEGWKVLGLAIDAPTPVRDFLARRPLGFPIVLAGLEGTQWSRELGNAQGGLPFTVLFDRHGRLVQRKLGETNFDELMRWRAALRG